MQNNIRDATVYITYLQLGYNLHADALKKEINVAKKYIYLGTFSTATGTKDAILQKF